MKFTITGARVHTRLATKLTKVQKWVCKWFKITPEKRYLHTVYFVSPVELNPNEILMFENGLAFVVTSTSNKVVCAEIVTYTIIEDINVNGVVYRLTRTSSKGYSGTPSK